MNLRERAALGAKHTGAAGIITAGLQLAQLAILAHFLAPADFGLMSMALVIIGFVQNFADLGISNAIIHRQNITRNQLSSLYWLNIVFGLIIFILIWATTPLIVSFYKEPRLSSLMVWASIVFVIAPIGQQIQVLLQKELRLDQLSKVEMISVSMGVITSVCFAATNHGVYSLIWGQLTTAVMKALLLVFYGWPKWQPTLHFKKQDLMGFIGFGLYQMGERGINYFASNVDYLIIGHFLGPKALGAYMLSYQLVVAPMMKINPIITRVALPVFAKKQDSNELLRSGFLEVTRLVALLALPVLVGLPTLASLFIPAIFGNAWEGTIPLVQILAIVGILRTLGNPSGLILLAKGRVDIGFKFNAVVAIINASTYLFAIQYGIYALALSCAILSAVYFILLLTILRSLVGLEPLEYFASIIKPVIASSAMGVMLYTTYRFLVLTGITITSEALLSGALVLGIIAYGSLIIILERRFLIEIWRLFISKRVVRAELKDQIEPVKN